MRAGLRVGAWVLGLLALPILGAAWARWPVTPLPPGTRADRLVLEKGARRLTAWRGDHLLRAWTVALGSEPSGPKRREGDGRTPEGRYRIDGRTRTTRYHLALHVSYPSPADVARARSAGEDPGGAILLHGLRRDWAWAGRLHRLRDWTRGCVALTDAEIEELWRLVPDGTPIDLRP